MTSTAPDVATAAGLAALVAPLQEIAVGVGDKTGHNDQKMKQLEQKHTKNQKMSMQVGRLPVECRIFLKPSWDYRYLRNMRVLDTARTDAQMHKHIDTCVKHKD